MERGRGWTREGRERERGRGGQGREKKGSGVGRWTREGRERQRGREMDKGRERMGVA